MNETTQNLLNECKLAGYTHVSIGMKDKRVPSSLDIEWIGDRKYKTMSGGHISSSAGLYTGGAPCRDLNGNQTGWLVRPHVVCAWPKMRQTGRPAIWDILKNSPLTAGLPYGGAGCCETHQVRGGNDLLLGVFECIDGEWITLSAHSFQ